MLNCKDVTRKIASDEFREAGWGERLGVRFHLFMCRHCRRYAVQLRVIGAAARKLCGPRSQDPSTLERLERQILERSLGRPEGCPWRIDVLTDSTGDRATPLRRVTLAESSWWQ